MAIFTSTEYYPIALRDDSNGAPQRSAFFVWTSIVAVAIFIASRIFYPKSRTDEKGNKIPDGPIGLPILGSFPFLTDYPELTLDYWAKRFGSLYSIRLGDQLAVVISDPQVAKDLMVSNGANFSSRKEMYIKSQIIFARRGGITATPYNDRWKKQRRLATTWLSKAAVDGYMPFLDSEASILVNDLYQQAKGGQVTINPQAYVGRASLNNMLNITFGIHTDSVDHPLVGMVLRISREFMNLTGPVSNMIDFVPLLQKLPSALRDRGQKLHDEIVSSYGGMISAIEERMNNGEDVPDCLVKTLLLAKEEEGMDHLDVTILVSAFMIGGVETTSSIVQWFSAIIPAYADVQAKAHAELDRVVGRGRLPTIEDERNLPYIRAIIKEVERSHNPFWLGTPHKNMKDFTYRGQFIPKDTLVIMNTYTMHHDPQRYPDPHTFNPDRYINDAHLSSESAHLANPMERDHWMFGVGRRLCPGMLVAEREVFLAVSRMLWAFKMSEIPGEPIDLKEYDGLSGRSPVPFRIQISPRDEQVEKVMGLQVIL